MREVVEWYATRPDVVLIFEGKVVKQEVRSGPLGGPPTAMSMTLSGKHRVLEFDVTRVFRGTNQVHLSIVTGLGTGDCGYDFWPGETYLVYAISWPGGIWFTSICSGTSAIEDSGTAVRFLTGEKPTADDLLSPQEYQKQYYERILPKRTGFVCGQVLKPDGSPLKGASVELWEPRNDDLPPRGGSDPNTSTDTGHFCVENVPPGKYFLTAESSDFEQWARYIAFYPSVNSQANAVQLSIQAGVRLSDIKLTTFHESVYRIRIRVLASDKTPLSYKNGCGVAVDSVDRNPLSYHISHTLEDDGTYTFGYIPPGKYQITTYFEPDFDGGEMKPFPEAAKWKPARQEVVVGGATEVVVHLESASVLPGPQVPVNAALPPSSTTTSRKSATLPFFFRTEITMPSSRRHFLKVLSASSALASLDRSLPLLDGLPHLEEKVSAARLAADPLRPQFHLLPARNWMNDPNGPIFWNGNYHMFFQYNPNAAVWGDMHWAHAMSPDMLHWKHLPIALAPTPGGYDQDGCFTGSAVVFQGTPTLVYTAVKSTSANEATLRDGTHNFLETQCLATSNDPQLLNWDKLPAPVLLPPKDPKLAGFRDPFLWNDADKWYLGVGSGQRGEGGRVLLYRSTDLRHWEYLRTFASGKWNGKHTPDVVDSGEMWECPDFFQLGSKYALLYSTERKVYWQAGELDRKEMIFHSEKSGFLDQGAFYAPKSQLDAKGRRILWGWIPETRPEAEFSAAGWAGCMSLPRVLSLDANNGLAMRMIDEITQLRAEKFAPPGSDNTASVRREALRKFELKNASAEFQLRFSLKPFHLDLTDGKSSLFSLSYHPARTGQELQIGTHSANLPPAASGDHELHLFLDGSVIECIADDRAALTTRIYSTNQGNLHLVVPDSELDAITSLSAWPIRLISPDRLTS